MYYICFRKLCRFVEERKLLDPSLLALENSAKIPGLNLKVCTKYMYVCVRLCEFVGEGGWVYICLHTYAYQFVYLVRDKYCDIFGS